VLHRPGRALFDRRLGRPSVPVDTLLRLLYLKHRYGLGYESLCREVADSLSWRRFCRIPLDRPVPHPTTLVKLVRRAGPQVTEQLNAALLAKLAQGKLLRGRKLRVDTTVVEADIDYPTDADLLEHAVRKLGGLVRRVKGRGAAGRTRFRDRGRAAGRRMRQLARTLRRRTGVAMAEVDRLLAQTDQRLAGNRVIPDRLVSLADPDARPIRKGKPRAPTQFGYTVLLAERGVARIGLRRKGTLSAARAELERTRAFRRLRNWRVGIEARISHLKRAFGLRRTRLRRLGGARTWVGLGIFAYNLQRMTVVAA
jgi:IS5 family transposase